MSRAAGEREGTGGSDARTRTPSRDIRDALVMGAEAVLVRDGPAAVTVRAVAAQAGVAPMGVYNHLGGKDGLIEALLVQGFDRLRAALASRGETDPVERLRAAGLRYREFAMANRRHYALMFEAAIPFDMDGSPAVREHATAAFGELVGHVEIVVVAGTRPASDAFDLAQQMWSSVHGAVALELKGLILTPDPAATYRALLELLLRGLAT